ncbi:MAG TPA: ATP-binding protein [Candidatus Sulfomarinibacteraceae bacterium]|nr:ATP-binding protein [Candidatus Sulfomarinibacteraceae bacterium]
MDQSEAQLQTNQIQLLWEKITGELSEILDAHGVCAAVAYEIAVYTGVTTVVALGGPLDAYYDVWICDGTGNLQQKRWEGEQQSLRRLIAGAEAVHQEKFDLPASDLMNSDLWLLPRDTLLFAPLPYPQNRKVLSSTGALCLIDPPQDCIIDAGSAASLAMYITTYLERAFLRQETDRQQVEFATVYDLTYSLTASLQLESIFSQLTDPVRRTLNVETISVGLTDEVTGEIEFIDMLMGPRFKDLPPIRLKSGQGIAGEVARTGEPLIVNNVYKDERFHREIDDSSGFRTNSILCVPLKVEQRVIGVLEAINKQHGSFNKDDLRLLQAITGPLAAAIENARLHEDVVAEKRRQETIFASMSEGALTVNARGIITTANESLLTLLGYESDDPLIGQPAQDAIQIHAREDFANFMDHVLPAGEGKSEIAADLVQSNGGQVPVLISGAPIVDDEGEPSEMIFVFTDLRQIREVERMRDDFFHNIVHELRTPLATILMYARLLREGKAQGDKAKEDRFLGVVERESDRLQQMVRQMLQLAKMEAREIQRSAELVNLNVLFDDILPPLAERAVQKGLTFSQRVSSDLPPVLANEEMIHSVFKNLVENAIKFTMSGAVRVEASTHNGLIEVIVRDDGIGIPKEAQPNLFKRFYRAQTAVERGIAGTGLGLYMVKEAIEKHQGSIAVESAEGEGTTFTVILPIAKT